VLDELARIRDGGVQVGVTVTGTDQPKLVRAALKVRRGGTRLFDAVQATWNLFEQSAGEALDEAHARGVRVVVKEPLANGKLTSRGERRGLRPLLELAKSERSTPDAVALAAVLAQPWADVVLLGAATKEQLRSNVKAAEIELTRSALEDVSRGLRMEPAAYWKERQALQWK
jgi:aryl-alcohol dehydrogenase-like predicted oxidoreductase